jgi:hypothetical protein
MSDSYYVLHGEPDYAPLVICQVILRLLVFRSQAAISRNATTVIVIINAARSYGLKIDPILSVLPQPSGFDSRCSG